MTTRARTQRRAAVRGFALIWMLITILVGVATFFAIYIASPAFITGSEESANFGIPPADNGSGTGSSSAVAQATAEVTDAPTAAPTTAPSSTPLPAATATSAAVAQAQQVQAATAAPTNTPAPTATPLPVNNRTFQVGTQVQYSLDLNPENQDGWMRLVQQLGMGWFKMQVRWEDVEPERGVYDWSKLDLAMPSAGRFGLNVMMSIVTAPEWSREPGVDTTKHGPPANTQDFVNFIVALLERYPGQVQAIEVWNEQNLDREWTSIEGLSAANYIEMLRQVYLAVKEVDPGIIVISGALSPTGGWTEPDGRVSAIDDFDYLDQMIAAGLLTYTDCVGVHHNGYNIGPNVPWDEAPNDPNAQTASFRGPFDNPHHSWSFYSTLNTYHNKIALATPQGGTPTPLCITEFGWAVTEDLGGSPEGFGFANDNTLAEQAEWTVQALDLMDEWGFVWLAFLWNLNYGPQAGWEPTNDNVPYSLIGPNWSFRPVYDEVRKWSEERRASQGG